MRSRFTKMLAFALSILLLMTCMTGCDTLNYREAVQLYNARRYEKAAELFSELGDYEDSAQLLTACHYWMATELMDEGNYAEALPRFLKLGNYEDAAQRVTECKYQLAIQAFEAENYTDAEIYFRDVADYRLTGEYLRQLNWQKLYDFILKSGEESGGSYVISQESGERTVSFMVDMTAPEELLLIANRSKDMGYSFRDELQLSLKRDATTAAFTASSSFTMDFGSGQIGTEQSGSGTVDLASYAPGAELTLDAFSLTGTDNLGNSLESQDSADCTMDTDMVNNLSAILSELPILLAEAGAEAIF